MKLEGIRHGDVVQLRDDPSLWLVTDNYPPGNGQPRKLRLRIPRSGASCTARAGQIASHWRLAGRPKRGGT